MNIWGPAIDQCYIQNGVVRNRVMMFLLELPIEMQKAILLGVFVDN